MHTDNQPSRKGMRLLRFLLLFVVLFVVLQRIYVGTHDYTDQVLNHWMNASVSSWVINSITPAEQVTVNDTALMAEGIFIDIKKGCEGFEVLIILLSALIAFPMNIKHKLAGMVLGFVCIYTANLIRIISLYYVARHHPDAFNFMHISFWQTVLILFAFTFFVFWIKRPQAVGGRCRNGNQDAQKLPAS